MRHLIYLVAVALIVAGCSSSSEGPAVAAPGGAADPDFFALPGIADTATARSLVDDQGHLRAKGFASSDRDGDRWDGPFRAWNAAGQLVVECSYRDGALHGPCHIYDDAGRLIHEGIYQAGVLDTRRHWTGGDEPAALLIARRLP